MLAVSPLVNASRDDHRCLHTAASTTDFVDIATEDWPDFSAPCDENESTLDILEGIDNFDDLFVRIGKADVLPDLEMDPKTLGEYSGGGSDEPEANKLRETVGKGKVGDGRNKDGAGRMVKTVCGGKNKDKSQVKKKLKVEWTSELHRKFVKAVEQLGVEQAVPSRILEIMNVHFLTRHNIASHLQKYRSHRKHLLAREGEASRWNLRRKATVAVGGKKAWTSTSTTPPVLGYPTMRCFGPLHVWGHPTWPQHNPNPNPPSSGPPSVPPPTPLPSYWPQQPFYPQGYGRPSSNDSIHTPETSIGVPLDFHLSNESIDAVIKNVISNPWLPLPIGLKPPSLDGTMTELQRQGIFKIPPPLD